MTDGTSNWKAKNREKFRVTQHLKRYSTGIDQNGKQELISIDSAIFGK